MRAEPFNYTGRTVVAHKTYQHAHNEIEQAVAEEDAALNIIQDIHIEDLDDESEDENDNLEVNVALIADIASSK